MKYLMYETTEFSTETGGTARFRELYNYLNARGIADIYMQSDTLPDAENVYRLDKNLKRKYRFCQFYNTRVTLNNKAFIKKTNDRDYKKVFVFDVPACIGLSLLKVKHVCLMIRKDLLDYKKILLESQNASKLKIFFWMRYLNICEAICLKNAENIIVQCHYDKFVLLERHRFLRNKISGKIKIQINNVNPAWIEKNSSAELLESDPHLDRDVFNICCVSGFGDKRKGADIMLKAFSEAFGSDEHYKLHMVGDGKELEKYREQYSSYPNIVFWGRLSNPTKILRQCTMAVVPSRADSCPNTVMEAIYNGIPVIGSNAGGIPEIINDTEAIFEPDWESLKKNLETAVSDASYLPSITEKQKERKNELTFDWVSRIVGICG